MIQEELKIELDYSKLGQEKTDYEPTLQVYVPHICPEMDKYRTVRPTILIIPGGAYRFTSEREAEPIALYYNSKGFNCFVLRYSCKPARFPVQLAEAAKALGIIREHAAEWEVDTDNIFALGFSAGGHLAASLGVYWNTPFITEISGVSNEYLKLKGLILSYPVISNDTDVIRHGSFESFENLLGDNLNDKEAELKVDIEHNITKDMPPCFIWHTFADMSVPLETTLKLASALREKNIPFEMHIYEKGRHGMSLGTEVMCLTPNERLQTWADMSVEWMKEEHVGNEEPQK